MVKVLSYPASDKDPTDYQTEGDVDGARIRLKASVEAVIPKLICDQDEIDAGYLVANQYKDVEMTITNVNSCQLKWKLEVMRTDRTTGIFTFHFELSYTELKHSSRGNLREADRAIACQK